MNDKIVTHADLDDLRGIRDAATTYDKRYVDDPAKTHGALALLDRLIAAAEADAPPLPEPAYLGAVVRNSHGDTYIRTSVGARKREWTREGTSNACHWTETEAVEVLPPTVQGWRMRRMCQELGVLTTSMRAAFTAAGIEVV